MEDMFKKVILAGVGSLALTYEKANALVKELVEKGELTVNQGKQLNEELKRKVENESNNTENTEKKPPSNEDLNSLGLATKEDIDNLNKRIDDLEKRLDR